MSIRRGNKALLKTVVVITLITAEKYTLLKWKKLSLGFFLKTSAVFAICGHSLWRIFLWVAIKWAQVVVLACVKLRREGVEINTFLFAK